MYIPSIIDNVNVECSSVHMNAIMMYENQLTPQLRQ